MLEKVKLHNFKSHQDTEINFDNSGLHALVGQNSSGKTSVLQALHYLSQLTNSSFEDIFKDERAPQFITTIGQDNMSVTATGFWKHPDINYWKASYDWRQSVNHKWTFRASWKADKNPEYSQVISETSLMTTEEPIQQSLRNAVHLKLVASNLAKAAYSDLIIPRVEFDGSGLAPTLDYLREADPEQFQYLEEMLQRIVPSVEKLGVRRAKVIVNRQRLIQVDDISVPYEENQEMTGQEVVLDMNTGKRIPAHAISEGTMLALGLLTVLINPTQPNLVLLDDVEQGLHPKAQRELIAVFKEIIQQNNNLQIIFSTHSPYIVDELTPSQVHVLSNNNSGVTRCKRLDEHPDVEWAKQTLTTGEFWDAEGEDWVVAGEIND
jgi:predicted ATPase